MKYTVYTGVVRTKLNIKKYIFGASAAIALTVGFSAPALASSVPANFPGNTGTSCDAGHGAPGGLGKYSPYYWVQNDPGFGQEQGVVTGQNNSSYSAYCNQ